MKNIKKNLSLVIIGILIAINFGGLAFLFYQQNQFLTRQGKRFPANQLKNQTSAASDKEALAKIDQAFLNEKEVIAFISGLGEAGLSFEDYSLSFDSESALTNKAQPYLPLTLTFNGAVENSFLLIEKLLSTPYALEISNLQIKSDDNFVNQTEVVVKINLYVSKSFP